jgi:fimbrial chaperone protein
MTEQGPRDASVARRCAALAIALMVLCFSRPGRAQEAIQGFTVSPVTVEMLAGERATILTIQNHTDREATFQVRPFAWSQPAGSDQLDPTGALVVSPPLGVVPAGSRQVVRLVLRRPAEGREVSYRILLDQVPGPPAPGQVGFVLRLSFPVFVEPPGRIAPQLRWAVESQGASASLVASNGGSRRQVVRDMKLTAPDGRALPLEANVSPYILAGGVRRWRILDQGARPPADGTMRLTAHAEIGEIDQAVPVRRAGP